MSGRILYWSGRVCLSLFRKRVGGGEKKNSKQGAVEVEEGKKLLPRAQRRFFFLNFSF